MTKTMKKIPTILLAAVIAVAFAFAIGAAGAQEAHATLNGEGTEQKPYKISDYDELKEFASIVNGGDNDACGKLMNDITCDDKAWVPISNNFFCAYTGHFDGNHKVIYDLSNEETSTDKSSQGLFGQISGGEVKDVGIVGGAIIGDDSVGGVAGISWEGRITNCYNTGTVSGSRCVGGVVGHSEGVKITNCYNTGAVSGTEDYVGGIVGDTSGTITNCYNTGAVSGTKDYVGGIVGDTRGTITNCYNTGAVSGTGDAVGGVAGRNDETIDYCYYNKELNVVKTIGSGTAGTNVEGLETSQMVGTAALENGNMVFSYESPSENPWLKKEAGKDADSGTYYEYYPHLNGFAYDISKKAADWPGKLIASADWSDDAASYDYNGSAQGPTVTKVISSPKSVEIPDGMKAEWRVKNVIDVNNSEWSEPIYDEPSLSGVYKLTIKDPKDGDKIIEEIVYIIFKKKNSSYSNDYNVTYQVQKKTAGGGTEWFDIDPDSIVKVGNYKVAIQLSTGNVLEEREFRITRPLTITAPTASAITYGQTLNDSSLTDGVAKEKDAEVPGTFTWDEPDMVPAVSDSNHTEYEVTFTPADTENYDPQAAKVTVTVNKATITIAADNKSSKYGEALKKLTYKVSGAYVKDDNLGVKLSTAAKNNKPGAYPIKVTWNKNPNYTATLKNGTYTVGKKSAQKINKAAAKTALDAGVKAYSSGSKVTASWGAVKGASSYVVYANYCSAKTKCKKIKTVSGKTTSIDITKLNGKKFNPKKNLKFYVVAYKTVKGKKVKLAKSVMAHAPGSKNTKRTNVTGVKVKKSKYTLKKGNTAKIKAKLILQKKNRKPLKHEAKFRYATSNAKVAKVNKKGKITAVGKGKCTVYVYAVSGVSKKIKVTVK